MRYIYITLILLFANNSFAKSTIDEKGFNAHIVSEDSGCEETKSLESGSLMNAPVFVITSNHPLIASWVDGHVNLNDGVNNYDMDVTEFDNIIQDVEFGTYDWTFTQAGGCYLNVTGSLVVDAAAIDPMSGNVVLNIVDQGENLTSASVFVSTSNDPIIASWVDGHVNLNDGVNNYDYDVTEFDNVISDVNFSTYTWTFTQAGGCFDDITGTLVVDCDAIDGVSENVELDILDEGTGIDSAPVFVSTTNHPIIGSWVDGHVNLNDGINNYDYDVTEFDNVIADVAISSYTYTFTQAGGCFPSITGSLTVDCDVIDPISGNVVLTIIDESDEITNAPVFVSTSNHPIIGSWVDGHVNLNDGLNNYDYNVTEFDNIITDIAFGIYTYTFTQAGGCYAPITGSLIVDCGSINEMSGNVLLNILDEGEEITSAPVFVLTSNHPLIGSWVDGHVTLSNSMNSYEYDVTEFDNIIDSVAFGMYDYTFTQAGGCYAPITGSLTVDCEAINEMSGNVLLNILDEGEEMTSAPVFVLTSNHPLIGSWVDGHVTLSDSINSYEYDVTEFDNIIDSVAFGTYDYTLTQAGGCYAPITGSLIVDCGSINEMSGNVLLSILDEGEEITSVPVFVLTSNHPLIGSWVDGHVTLSDSINSYEYDVTEFDNIIDSVAFGTYDYTFTQAGGCYAPITGSLTVDCGSINEMSGNVLLNILDEGEEITSAPVFVLTSNHPLIGSWVDGHVTLSNSMNSYEYDVTEFDNIIDSVAFGMYDYTFTQAGGCYTPITGSLTVGCEAIDDMSGNVLLNIIDEGDGVTTAPVFVLTSNHPIIGSWVDGHVNLNDGVNNYDYDVTEFDNIIDSVVMSTYTWTFTRAGGCYPTISGSLTVNCESIDSMSGNVLLNIIDQGEELTTAPVFVLTSNHPLIGSWVDGHVELSDSMNSYEYDITEFDNIIDSVAFGTYNYTFTQAGGCYVPITGSLIVDCEAINEMSGNVLLNILDEGMEIVLDTSVTQMEADLTANATGVSYQWVDCNNENQPIEGETNQTFTATSNGSYAVIITDSTCLESKMSSCFEVISLNSNDIEASSFTLYPNPVIDILTLDLNGHFNTINVQIYDISGSFVKQVYYRNLSRIELDVSEFAMGNYVIKVQTERERTAHLFFKQ